MIGDWWVAGACLLAAGLCVYGLWRVSKWSDAEFDRHADMAAALTRPEAEVEARRRHPASRSLAGRAATATGWCARCQTPVVGPMREHLHEGRAR